MHNWYKPESSSPGTSTRDKRVKCQHAQAFTCLHFSVFIILSQTFGKPILMKYSVESTHWNFCCYLNYLISLLIVHISDSNKIQIDQNLSGLLDFLGHLMNLVSCGVAFPISLDFVSVRFFLRCASELACVFHGHYFKKKLHFHTNSQINSLLTETLRCEAITFHSIQIFVLICINAKFCFYVNRSAALYCLRFSNNTFKLISLSLLFLFLLLSFTLVFI